MCCGLYFIHFELESQESRKFETNHFFFYFISPCTEKLVKRKLEKREFYLLSAYFVQIEKPEGIWEDKSRIECLNFIHKISAIYLDALTSVAVFVPANHT